jgi:SpoVK/Ycf46/Vps4 family AAA+-type ATPase
MEHFLEILKIIEGAVNADFAKVVAYAEQLSAKLDKNGDEKSARRVRSALANARTRELTLSRAGQISKVPTDSESRLSLADEMSYQSEEVFLVLESDVQSTVDEFLTFVRSADYLIAEGIGISPSLLIHGPPGCGKTQLGHYIAAQLDLPLLTARSDGLISSYLGNTAKNLRNLFEHAMQRPCILFLDEFDALAKLRDDQYELGELKRVVISLLQGIDALDNKTILLAATNHEHLLDPAVWRRFAFKIKLEKPAIEIRKKLFEHYLGEFEENGFCQAYAEVSAGLTGSDIRQLAEDAKRHALVSGHRKIEETGMLRRILQLRLPEKQNENSNIAERIRRIRSLNHKVFTFQRLADIFGVSRATAHRAVREKE